MAAKKIISEEQKATAEEQIRALRKEINRIIPEIIRLISLFSSSEKMNFIFPTNIKGSIFGIMRIKIGSLNLFFWGCLFPLCFSLIPRMGDVKL